MTTARLFARFVIHCRCQFRVFGVCAKRTQHSLIRHCISFIEKNRSITTKIKYGSVDGNWKELQGVKKKKRERERES